MQNVTAIIHEGIHNSFHAFYQWSNCRGVGVELPYLTLPTPYLWSKFDPGGVEFQSPHLSFAEVGMLLDLQFLLMQFLKYLQRDDLNVTTSFF